MTEREMAAVLLAYADGAAIQSRGIRESGCWIDVPRPMWNFYECEYRVKPKQPREWIISGGIAFEVKPPCDLPPEGIHVREVLEDDNARLIAAAPDLLEACRRLLGWDFWDQGGSAGRDAEFARAVIAKATGEKEQEACDVTD